MQALWKKVQKIATKNKASDTINKATPIFKPFCTAKVWLPKYVPSEITSLNQKAIEQTKDKKDKTKKLFAFSKPWNDDTLEVVSANKLTPVYSGQGDGETKWKGWAWNLLLSKLDISSIMYSRK